MTSSKHVDTIPFGWLIKLGADSCVTDKAEVLIEIGCCLARRLFLNIIDVLVSVLISNMNSFKISTNIFVTNKTDVSTCLSTDNSIKGRHCFVERCFVEPFATTKDGDCF